MTQFEVFYNHKKEIISADDLWNAKQKAIKLFNVPKRKEGLVALQSIPAKNNQNFRYT